MKTPILIAALLSANLMTLAQTAPAKPESKPVPVPKAAKLTSEQVHRSALVIDTHEDTPQRFLDDHFDLSDPLNGGQVNLDAIHKGNLGASFMSIWVEPELYKGHYARRTLELIDASRNQAAKHPDQIKFSTSTTLIATWSNCASGITRGARDAPASRRESTFVRCCWDTSKELIRNVELPGGWPTPCRCATLSRTP